MEQSNLHLRGHKPKPLRTRMKNGRSVFCYMKPRTKVRGALLSGNKKNGFLSLLGLILTVGIIIFLCYLAVNTYFHKPVVDKESRDALAEQGIDASSRQAVLESTKRKIADINKEANHRADEIITYK